MPTQVEKWFEMESGAIAALVSHPRGYLVLPPRGKAWEWVPAESDEWSALDQRIFRQGRATELAGPPPSAPPLPAPGPAHRKDDPDALGRWAEDGALLRWVEQAPGKRRVVYLVLQEDPYETNFGDGLFRDPVACFADESAARTHPLHAELKRHLRRIELRIDSGRLQAKGERHDFADRYKVEKAMELLKLTPEK